MARERTALLATAVCSLVQKHVHSPRVFALHLLEPIAKTAAKPCSFSWGGFSVDPSSLKFCSKYALEEKRRNYVKAEGT